MSAAANPRERYTSETMLSPRGPLDADAAIRTANADFEQRVGSSLSLALAVLVEQRDQAIRSLQQVHTSAAQEREARVLDQDSFIAFLMADHEKQVLALQQELNSLRQEVGRQRTLASVSRELARATLPGISGRDEVLQLELNQRILALQESLQAAYAEVDDTRADAMRLQEERDSAIREINDLKFDFEKQIETARDEGSALQWQLDETQRKLADASDQARDDAYRTSESLDEVRRQLDERNEEVRSLRARLMTLDEEIQSRPPPAAGIELENARKEAQLLRRSLIDSKRELARLNGELNALRARGGLSEDRPLERESALRKR
ncbi:MAG: hypothetical protein QM756_32540 [Polyangiaceae bacterium]